MLASLTLIAGAMVSNLLILVGLTYLVSLLLSSVPQVRTAWRGAAFGLALGAVAGVVMFHTVRISDGMFLDLRNVVVLMSTLLGGPVAGLVTGVIAFTYRLMLADGANNLVPGVGITLAVALGIVARHLGTINKMRTLLTLGVVLAVLRSATPFLAVTSGDLQFAEMLDSALTILPLAVLLFPFGTIIMGTLLKFELLRADRAADLRSENQILSERDQRFQKVFDLSSVAMLWTSQDGRIVRANQRMADLVGYTVEELQNMHYYQLLPADDRADYYRIRDEEASTRRPQKDFERRYLRKDGGIFWGLRAITRVQSSSGEPIHKFVMIQDVTERRQAEDKIRFQAELLASVDQAVMATDVNGAIIFWNRVAETLTGWPADEVIGRDIGAVLPPIRNRFDPSEVASARTGGASWSREFAIERRDGSTIHVQVGNAPVHAENGELLGVVAMAVDVTEEKGARLALLEEQRVLGILNRTAVKLNAESDLTTLLQTVIDAGVELTGAEFGAIYSGRISPEDDHFELYAVSGIMREDFRTLPLPYEEGVVGPILRGEGIFRWDDVTLDALHAESLAARSAAAGGRVVRSYLAAPLIARSGKVIGALFLGHTEAGVFTERTERTIEGIASHAAIAVEKASLFQAAQQEIEIRKKAEATLNESEARFRDFAEVGSDILWETDAEFRITSILGDSRAVFGLSEDELIGRTAWEFAKADVKSPEWKQHIIDHKTQQPFRNFEYQIVDRNGTMRWISANGRPYYDGNGRLLGFRGSSTNIAARKHAEAKLAASARQQQSAAVLSQLALQGVPRDDLYQVAVELVARTLGVELVGILELSTDKRVLRLRAGNGWPSQSVNIRAVPLDYCPPLARGISSDVPVHFSRRNFNLIPGLQNDKGSGVALPIGEKSVRIGVLVVCSDGFRAFSETDINFLRAISFVLAADAEQRKAEATLRLRDRALEAIGEGILITDTAEFDNPVIYVNPAFEQLTGYSKEEATGRNARYLQGEETDKKTMAEIRSAVENETAFRGSILNYRKDGTPFWNNLTISPIRDANGTTSNFVGILSDETERIQLASQLRQAQKMESLGHLTGGVAHDFNNLLAVILGNSEILFEEIEDPELKATAELVMTTAEKGADLTQRLLAFGRRQALHPEPLDLENVIDSLLDMLNRTLGSQVRIETRSTADRLAFVDRSLFESAILNLSLNARDAMPNGGTLTIETHIAHWDGGRAGSLAPGDYVHVSVTDTGEGMAQDVLERAFDPFFTTKGVGKGSGMGLPMVYGFAKQSGGHVTIESRIGHGTTVHLYIPIAKEAEVRHVAELRQDLPAGGSERILLVEDEPQVRRFVSNQLAGLGYSVLEAEAGAPALDILKSDEKIDLLFTDLLMPGGMSGFDLVQRAREFLPDLKVLLTTGYAAETDAMLANVKEPILKKPYKKQQLAHALRSVIDHAA